MLAMIVLTFLFEMGSYLLAFMVGLTVDSMSIFIVYSLVPTMILNFYGLLFFNLFLKNIIYKNDI